MSKNPYRRMRYKYKPNTVSYLLVAESPPKCPPGTRSSQLRFFYNPKIETKDYFFKSVMEVVFQDFKKAYRKGDKGKWLKRFMRKGFFMIDATDTPINKEKGKRRNQIIENESKMRIREIKKLAKKRTPVFLVKKNIFKIFYKRLKEEGVYVANDELLPFPSTGQQGRFKTKFKEYLEKIKARKRGI